MTREEGETYIAWNTAKAQEMGERIARMTPEEERGEGTAAPIGDKWGIRPQGDGVLNIATARVGRVVGSWPSCTFFATHRVPTPRRGSASDVVSGLTELPTEEGS